jgi:hypothetical protein
MRLVKVIAPKGKGTEVIKLAFSVGIKKASIFDLKTYSDEGDIESKESVDVECSTPKAKKFIDALLASDLFNIDEFSLTTRQPRSIISKQNIRELTAPLVEPATDLNQELWQFSQITYGYVGRVFLAACLLAYGLIQWQILLVIAGLLFLPLLPVLLAIGFGVWTKQWKLAWAGFLTFTAATFLLIVAGITVALLTGPPVRYDDFSSIPVSFLISLAVGIAAGLATTDDVGRRELIGLAVSAQIVIIPVWFGICFVFGFPATTGTGEIQTRALTFFINVLTVIISSLAVYILQGIRSRVSPK